MFADIFETADDLLSNDQNPVPFQASRPKNCAYALNLPPLKREYKQFVGLRNQGATCYLNSLIQSLYMSPEFRREIFKLPLCDGDIEHQSNFVDSTKKHNLLLAFQKLFTEMQYLDLRSVSTEDMTKSFGWENNQELLQQDIQEAFRVFLDCLERALYNTTMQDCISKNYQGILVNHISCLKCGTSKERPELFYDLLIPVKGFTDLEQGLRSVITPETLEGDNQYFCEVCNEKVDALKGVKIRKFPKILIFSLNRFCYDFEILDRIKINDNFAFSLEFNSQEFQENPNEDPSENQYELSAIILHRGDAYHGHYHAYIRDVINEGNWENLMKIFEDKREDLKKKALAEAELQKQSNKIEENLNKMELESKKKSEDIVETEKIEEAHELHIVEVKETVKDKKKGGKKQKKEGKNNKKNEKNEKNEKNDKNKKKDEKKPVENLKDEFFDELEFPIAFKNPDLSKNWFDFNDSTVTAIPVNRLQKQYGGSNENAYLLIYRQANLNKLVDENTFIIPEYLEKMIKTENEVLEKERQMYKQEEKHIELCIINSNDVNVNTLEYKTNNPEETKIRVNLDEKFEQLLNKLAYEKMTDLQQIKLVEIYQHGNKLLQFKRMFNYEKKDFKIQELELDHLSVFLLLRNEEKELSQYICNHLGEEAVPIKINLFFGTKNYTIIKYLNDTLFDLKMHISKLLELGDIPVYLRVLEGEVSVLLNVNQENDAKTLKTLKLANGSDIMVNIEDLEDKDFEETEEIKNEIGLEDVNLRSILVERDDNDETNKFFVSLNWTLSELFVYMKEKASVDEKVERRIRRLKGNALFYEEDMSKTLRELDFDEGGIRLRLERGPFPKFGNLAIKILIQSKFLPENKPVTKNTVSTPITTIQELLKEICEPLGLNPEKHKLYKTDWLEEPIEAISKIDKSLHMNSIKSNDILVLRDMENLIPKEIMKFCIHLTKTGKPDDSEYLDAIQIKEEENLISLKKKILSMPQMKVFETIDPGKLRVREIKKDLFFGRILRNEEKPLKKLNIKTYTLVCQVLSEPEFLDEDDVVLLFRKRNILTRTYEDYFEKILHLSKEPKIKELKTFLIDALQLQCSEDEIELAKYISHEFNWLHFHLKYFEDLSKKKKTGKKKKRGGAKAKANNKVEKPKNIENIRKSPYLLNDGDIIGYRLEAENIEKVDDFQTFADEELKMKIKELKKTVGQYGGGNKKNDAVGFQILIDF